MYKRVPELNHIIDALVVISPNVHRSYKFDDTPNVDYICPTCGMKFITRFIRDKQKRNYVRKSAQARRHYNKRVCIQPSTLVDKGYLRNDADEAKTKLRYQFFKKPPRLSNAINYILGLEEHNPNTTTLILKALADGNISLSPSNLNYKPSIEIDNRVCISQLISTDRKRAVSIPQLSIKIIGKDLDKFKIDKNIPNFTTREEIELFVTERLKIMSNYFRSKTEMRYFTSFKNSETLREYEYEMNDEMKKYIKIVDPNDEGIVKIHNHKHVGLLSK